MGLREKVALIFTGVLIVQISTSYCVPSAYRPDALQRYLDKEKGLKTTKSPYVTGSKNDSLKKSLIRAYNFPETEYPSDASTRDYSTLGNNFKTNSFGALPKKVSEPQNKAVEDLKKDMRMKRKLDKIQENYHTPEAGSTFTKSLSGPESIILTDKEIFPEVQYPLNAIDTWAPHYWNPPQIAQHELEYERPESIIFNQKVSDKSNKSYAPYKKQVKSKVKQFMEDIDLLNKKMRSSKTPSNESQDSNDKNESSTMLKNDFNKPDSNNRSILLLDPEALSNETTEPLRNIHEDLVNTSMPENRHLKGLPIELNQTNNLSLQTGTSGLKSNIPDLTLIPYNIQEEASFPIKPEHDSTPIPYKTQEENNSPLNPEHENVKKEDIHNFKELRNSSIPKEEKELVEKVKLQNQEESSFPIKPEHESTPIPYKTQEENNSPLKPEHENVKKEDIHKFKELRNSSIPKEEEELVEKVKLQNSLGTVILTDSADLQRTTLTANNTKPGKSTNTESLDQKFNATDIISNDDPLNVNIPLSEMDTYDRTQPDVSIETTPLSDINKAPRIIVVPIDDYVNMMQIPNFKKLSDSSIIVLTPSMKNNVEDTKSSNIFHTLPLIEEKNTIIPNTKSTTPDFEMLPNNSMCHVLSNDANSSNRTTQHFSGDKFTNTILKSENITPNTTPYLCTANNISEILSESVLPSTILLNTPVPLSNDLPDIMPSSIIPDLSLLDERFINSKSLEVPVNKVTKQLDRYTSFELTENTSPSFLDHVDPSPLNTGNNQQFLLEINKLSDINQAHNKIVSTALKDLSKIDAVRFLLPTTKLDDFTLEDEKSERNQDIVISKNEQIPLNLSLNISHYKVAGSKSDKGIDNDDISNTEEKKQILSIPLTNITKIDETILVINKNKPQMVTDELTLNNSVCDKDIQEGEHKIEKESQKNSMTLPHAPYQVITLAELTPLKEDSLSTKCVNLEDTTYLKRTTDSMNSVMENSLPQNETHNNTQDISVRNENEFMNNIYQSAPFLNIDDSKYEEKLLSESNIEYSLDSTDNQVLSNTDNDEQLFLDDSKVLDQIDLDEESDQKNYFIPNGVPRVPLNIDYITDIKNNSNTLEYSDTIQSNLSSAESFLSDTNKKNVMHAEENILMLPIDSHQNAVIKNESLMDTPPKYSVNKGHESWKEVTETVLNDVSKVDISDNDSTTVLNRSDKAIQETYTTDILPELIHKSEPDNITTRDKRLLARNNLTDPPRSNNKEVKTFPATLLTDIVNFNRLEVDKRDFYKSSTDDIIAMEEINEPFNVNPIPIYTDYEALSVDETLVKPYDDEELLKTDFIPQISPSTNCNVIQNTTTN